MATAKHSACSVIFTFHLCFFSSCLPNSIFPCRTSPTSHENLVTLTYHFYFLLLLSKINTSCQIVVGRLMWARLFYRLSLYRWLAMRQECEKCACSQDLGSVLTCCQILTRYLLSQAELQGFCRWFGSYTCSLPCPSSSELFHMPMNQIPSFG